MSSATLSNTRLARTGDWMRRNSTLIRAIQWVIVVFYAVLILVPIFLPLPDETAHIWSNLTLIAQFCFWGIWWPFVLVSMVLMGRVWCGVLCPEGALTEFASRFGRGWAIPRWMRWGGWPFVAFVLTTVYGQMVSVYQYPKAVLLVLGGSTLGAMVVGYLYGREKRVWCKYLCPVNGVFGLLAKLAPFHYKVNEDAWRASYDTHGKKITAVNCAPLVPLRNMKGAADCHMCGRCSSHRDAIALTWRAPTVEIVNIGSKNNNLWESALMLYGLFGIAIGAFHWTASPWFVEAKQFIATWLIERDIMWPFDTSAPWWLLTNYPQQSDVFSWLDGALVVSYIMGTGLVLGTSLSLLFSLSNLVLGKWDRSRFNHLVQSAIPLAGCGVFVGLSATTISLLRAEHWPVDWANTVRATLLTVMTLWSILLAWKVIGQHSSRLLQRLLAMLPILAGLALVNFAWLLMFWIW
jgi:polyferredoxin